MKMVLSALSLVSKRLMNLFMSLTIAIFALMFHTQLINTVRITNRTRVVQPYQDVYKVSDDTRPEGVIPASSSRVYSAQPKTHV